MKQIAIIIPSRTRPANIQRIHKQWFLITDKSITTDCVVVLDDDNESEYPRLEGFRYIVVHTETRGAVDPLNQAAMQICNEYEYIGFWGDDMMPLTPGWNLQFYNTLKTQGKYAMTYGDDGYQGERLPTQIVMDSSMIKRLGYMGHPEFRHICVDDFWKYIGKDLGTLVYTGNVKIEHRHYSIGKSLEDELYTTHNSYDAFEIGRKAYKNVTNSEDFQEILKAMKWELLKHHTRDNVHCL
jgi:hypothetical protein